jgi:hypothetical protein
LQRGAVAGQDSDAGVPVRLGYLALIFLLLFSSRKKVKEIKMCRLI